jgi:hypothetical protein
MRIWDFDQIKGYGIVLDATYAKIQELKDQIEEEELNDEKKHENI